MLPENYEVIAKYLATSSDMYLFLSALPKQMLTRPLQSLLELLLLDGRGETYHLGGCICYRRRPSQNCKIILWPTLILPCWKISPQIHGLVQNCVSLYSSIHSSSPVNDLRIPQTTKLTFQVAASEMLESVLLNSNTNGIFIVLRKNSPESYFALLMEMAPRLKKLQHLVDVELYLNDGSKLHVLIQILQMFTSLKELRSVRLTIEEQAYPRITWSDDIAIALADWVHKQASTSLIINSTDFGTYLSKRITKIPAPLMIQNPSSIELKNGELVGLYLNGFDIEVNGFDEFIGSIRSVNLQTLQCKFEAPQRSFQRPIKRLTAAQVLDFIDAVCCMTNITRLSLSFCTLDYECCRRLSVILPQLTELELSNNEIDQDSADALLVDLQRCSRLKTLCLDGQLQLNMTAIKIAHAIENGVKMYKLSLQNSGIGHLGAIALSKVMHRLGTIILSQNNIGYDGAIAISSIISRTDHMESIFLVDNEFSEDAALAIIANVKQSNCRHGVIVMFDQSFDCMEGIRLCHEAIESLPNSKWCKRYMFPIGIR